MRTVASVSCGAAHTMAIVRESSDGSGEVVVYGWGAHAAGQLGHAPDETRDALANEGRMEHDFSGMGHAHRVATRNFERLLDVRVDDDVDVVLM